MSDKISYLVQETTGLLFEWFVFRIKTKEFRLFIC